MSIYPELDLPSLERLHDDIEFAADPIDLLFSLIRAESELAVSLEGVEPSELRRGRTATPPPAAYRHWANFLAASTERAEHLNRLQSALDLSGKQARRARRLAPHTGSLVTTDLPDWCRASASTPPNGSISLT